MRAALLGLVLVVSIASCGGDGAGVTVTDARIGRPAGPNAALYLTARSGGAPDRLVGAATDVAASVELHESVQHDDGTVGMRPLEGLELPSGGELTLEPGGYHLMLLEVAPLEVGDTIEVVLVWETAGETTVVATVVAPGDTP